VTWEKIFNFFACNPLKRLDSAKEIQGNASNFALISLHFLAFAWLSAPAPDGAAWLVWTMNGFHSHNRSGGRE
jgi:hypothetical protein